ncbi:hypothetical protein HDV00_012253 [Rhizophlyctis rosea]|nr:hypothetical protein HDV00_012253 [Rhizophlyctis rosea]
MPPQKRSRGAGTSTSTPTLKSRKRRKVAPEPQPVTPAAVPKLPRAGTIDSYFSPRSRGAGPETAGLNKAASESWVRTRDSQSNSPLSPESLVEDYEDDVPLTVTRKVQIPVLPVTSSEPALVGVSEGKVEHPTVATEVDTSTQSSLLSNDIESPLPTTDAVSGTPSDIAAGIPAMRCPVCDADLGTLTELATNHHVNRCLDSTPTMTSTPDNKPSTAQPSLEGLAPDPPSNDPPRVGLSGFLSNVKEQLEGLFTTKEVGSSSKQRDETSGRNSAIELDSEPSAARENIPPEPEADITEKPADAVMTLSALTTVVETVDEGYTGDTHGRNQVRGVRKCPWYKRMPGTKFTVDAFMYGKIPGCEAYFLSHFHADHYGGLNSSFSNGPVYCSAVTGNLIVQQLRVKEEYVRRLPMDTPVDVMGVNVVLVDANHCPGAVLFLFEIPSPTSPTPIRHLHTGDFRAHLTHLSHPYIKDVPFNNLYLDTTYCGPVHRFPRQEDVVAACVQLARRVAVQGQTVQEVVSGSPEKGDTNGHHGAVGFLGKWILKGKGKADGRGGKGGPSTKKVTGNGNGKRTVFVVGSYTIGKEKIFKGVAKELGSKIHCVTRKRRVLACLEDRELDEMLTDEPGEADVHVVSMGELKPEILQDKLTSLTPYGFTHLIAFRPTGWTFRPDKRHFSRAVKPGSFTVQSLKPAYYGATGNIAVMGVPYSEHSSFDELEMFVRGVKVEKVVPTVFGGGEKGMRRVLGWCEEWSEGSGGVEGGGGGGGGGVGGLGVLVGVLFVGGGVGGGVDEGGADESGVVDDGVETPIECEEKDDVDMDSVAMELDGITAKDLEWEEVKDEMKDEADDGEG